MKFVYIGEYPPDGVSKAWGCEFRPGEAIEIPQEHVARASNNRFFLRAEPEVTVPGFEIADLSKAELIAIADKVGVTIDRRWSASRIQQTITGAANQLSEGP